MPEPPSCVTNVWQKMTRDEDTDSCGFRTQGNLQKHRLVKKGPVHTRASGYSRVPQTMVMRARVLAVTPEVYR